MTKAVIFTCEKHMPAAEIAAKAASRFFDVLLAVDESEQNVRSEFKIIRTSFKRFGNLNGRDACRGVARTLLDFADNGYVVKIDSDTVIKDPSMFNGFDMAGFVQTKHPPSLLGCCYGISKRAIEHSIACIDKSVENGVLLYPEDVIITGYAQTLNRDDFRSNIMPIKELGVWHPEKAPNVTRAVANFGIFRINGNWCHDSSLAAMSAYLNS